MGYTAESNKPTRKSKQKLIDRDKSTVVTRGKWGGEGVKCTLTEDLTLGGEQRMQYADDVPQKCSLKTHVILLTNGTPIHSIFKNPAQECL